MAQEKISREKIIAAVLDIAFSKSSAGTSLADIASVIGIKKASLYNHFENRDAIFTAVCTFCGQIMSLNPYIPPDYEASIQKYAPSIVLKGIVRRYIKVYEKDLSLRVYTFIASEKYFIPEACDIYQQEQEKILSQVRVLMNALKNDDKLDSSDPEQDAFWFANAVCNYTSEYLLAIKKSIQTSTRTSGLSQLAEIDAHIEWFCHRIGAKE